MCTYIMHAYTCPCTHVHKYIDTHSCAQNCMDIYSCIHSRSHVHKYKFMHARLCTHTRAYAHELHAHNVYLHIKVCTCSHTYYTCSLGAHLGRNRLAHEVLPRQNDETCSIKLIIAYCLKCLFNSLNWLLISN